MAVDTNKLKMNLPVQGSENVNGSNGVENTKETREAADKSKLKVTDLYSLAAQGAYSKTASFQNYDGFTTSGSSDKKSEEDKKTEELIKDGDSAKAEANEKKESAKGWTSKCKNFTNAAKQSVQQMLGLNKQVQMKEKTTISTLEKNNNEKEQLEAENGQTQSEIDNLTAERESLAAENPTPQAQPQAMMAMANPFAAPAAQGGQQAGGAAPQGNSLNVFAANTMPPQGGQNAGKLAELDGEIGSKSSKLTSNSSQITSISSNSSMTNMNFNNFIKNTTKSANKAKTTAQKNGKAADTAQKVGQVTTTIGGLTSSTGAAMMAFFPLFAPGTVVAGVGAATTVAGGATTGAACIAKGDSMGALSAAGSTLGAAASAKSSVKAISDGGGSKGGSQTPPKIELQSA